MKLCERRSLHALIKPAEAPPDRFLSDGLSRIQIRALTTATNLAGDLGVLRDRSVLISTARQLPAALALVALDGIARRIVLCTPDLPAAAVMPTMADAEVDLVVTDGTGPASDASHRKPVIACSDRLEESASSIDRNIETEWILLSSGTTGRPKLALHTLAGLIGPLSDGLAAATMPVWSTFYDIRRYGGLQILLRAFGGGGSMVLSHTGEPVGAFLERAGRNRVTHISGTPSHWRRALMSPGARRIAPDYVRLSGETCDQAILDNLRHTYPHAGIAHAFASTEAGVAFDVRDEKAGFPASLIEQNSGDVRLRVQDGSLRIRSSRTAVRYLGSQVRPLADEMGFIDTGDMLERRGHRYYFVGRREGIINVGGLKVHPEAVEAVINQHWAVSMSRVSGRPSPITGALVVAEIVVSAASLADAVPFQTIRHEILELCRRRLASHEVPVTVRSVPELEIAESGKLVRRFA